MDDPRLRRLPFEGFDEAPLLVQLGGEGGLAGIFNARVDGSQAVRARISRDGGTAWGDRSTLLLLPRGAGGWSCTEALADRDGRVHLFLLNDARTGVIDAGEAERPGTGAMPPKRLDIWHARSEEGLSGWSRPRCVWSGYTGALNSVVQLSGGRILLPFSYLTDRNWRKRGGGPGEFTFLGPYDSTVLHSDDGGDTWSLGNSLTVPVPDITYAYGAVEPVAVELGDGRVWMLIRTQMGRFYESFSRDGAAWSRPSPTGILSSDSPAGLVRLPDGRILLLWNNCLRFPYAYGGRQVLHAAVSADDGVTWRGFREVGRDPRRADPPPASGDFGTAYPFPMLAADGRVIFRSGQGTGRAFVVSMDPLYLHERRQRADFSHGLEDWSVFGTRGVDLSPSPDSGGGNVLRLRRIDSDFPACAVWNFPAGSRGTLTISLRMTVGSHGLSASLTDHFSVPFDVEAEIHAVAVWRTTAVEPGCWHELRMEWDCSTAAFRVLLDGAERASAPLFRRTQQLCYLRLRTISSDPEEGGAMIRTVEVETAGL